MIAGETIASGAPASCGKEPCGATGPLICKSAAGWYIGHWCSRCGPYSRERGYYWSADDARDALESGEYAR